MEARKNTVKSSSLAHSERTAAFRTRSMFNTARLRYSQFISGCTQTQRFSIMLIAAILIALGVVARIVPHEANFAPIAAMALFGGVYLRPKYSILIPLGALIVSDVALGFDSLASRLSVYGAFVLIGLIGLLIRRHKTITTVIGGTIAGSIVFYLVTNFVLLYPPVMYSHDLAGQLTSYYNALPFFRATLLGDLFYVGLLFGSYELIAYTARRNNFSRKGKSRPATL